jgi:hypothetical protein
VGANGGGNVFSLGDRGLCYRLRVLIKHPTENLEAFSRETGLMPSICAQRGDQRLGPDGAKLSAVHASSIWQYTRLVAHSRRFSNGITSLLDALTPAAASIQAIRAAGGSADLILELDGNRNIGDEIQGSELRRLAELGLDFALEVFPEGI